MKRKSGYGYSTSGNYFQNRIFWHLSCSYDGELLKYFLSLWRWIICVWVEKYLCFVAVMLQFCDGWTCLMIVLHLHLQQQLQSLMETLSSTEPHYIRCVKPNNVLKPAIFENANVIQQLRCGVSKIYNLYLPCLFLC